MHASYFSYFCSFCLLSASSISPIFVVQLNPWWRQRRIQQKEEIDTFSWCIDYTATGKEAKARQSPLRILSSRIQKDILIALVVPFIDSRVSDEEFVASMPNEE